MRAARRILVAKAFHSIAEFTKGRRGRSAREAAADDYDFKFPAVVRTDQSRMILVVCPFPGERSGRNFGVQRPNHIGWQNSKLESRNPRQTPENSNAQKD